MTSFLRPNQKPLSGGKKQKEPHKPAEDLSKLETAEDYEGPSHKYPLKEWLSNQFVSALIIAALVVVWGAVSDGFWPVITMVEGFKGFLMGIGAPERISNALGGTIGLFPFVIFYGTVEGMLQSFRIKRFYDTPWTSWLQGGNIALISLLATLIYLILYYSL